MADISWKDVTQGSTVTVKIKGEKEFRLRFAVGLFFVKLGIKITGMNFQYEGMTIHE